MAFEIPIETQYQGLLNLLTELDTLLIEVSELRKERDDLRKKLRSKEEHEDQLYKDTCKAHNRMVESMLKEKGE